MLDYLKKVLDQIREMNESVDEYKKLSPSGAMPYVAKVNQAIELIEKKDFDKAEELLLEAEEISKGNELVYRTLGKLYEYKLDFPKVIKYFQKAHKLNPNKRDIIMRLGYAQLNARKYDDAIETFERAVTLFPLDSEVYTARGMALYRMNRLEDARVDFVKAFALDAHNLNALFLCATIDVSTGEYSRAETRLSLLIKIAPNTMNLYEYSRLKRLKKEYDLAEEYGIKAIESNKNFLPSYILLSEIYLDMSNADKALKILERAQSENLLNDKFYKALGNVYLYKCDFNNAASAYNKAKEFSDTDWEISVKTVISELFVGNTVNEETIIACSESHKCVNKDEEALKYFMLGVWNYLAKNYLISGENLQKAVNLSLDFPILYELTAKSYANAGNFNDAVESFETALEKIPKNYSLHKSFIEFLTNDRQWEKVKFKSKNALKIFNNDDYFENSLFIASFNLLKDKDDDYNVKELIKLAEKLEKKSTFLYTEEKIELLKRSLEA